MEIRLFPNARRPGVGLPPREESLRPMLPQHARNCPVLEAGSGLGLLVYPPLEDNEAYDIEFLGEGRFRFGFYMGSAATKWQPMFHVTIALPVGGVGHMREDVEIHSPMSMITPEGARNMMRAFIVAEDLGTPTGAVTLRGATNFKTPEGWDTVFTSVINQIERPIAPILVVRIETDWYHGESEFRYVLQPGEAIPGARNMPVGQVFFVPREPLTLVHCTEEELTAIKAAKQEFATHKAEMTHTTPHGLQYSPYYARESRRRRP